MIKLYYISLRLISFSKSASMLKSIAKYKNTVLKFVHTVICCYFCAEM